MSNPIEHIVIIVIIVKENHTFDRCFDTSAGATGMTVPPAPHPQVADPLHDHAA